VCNHNKQSGGYLMSAITHNRPGSIVIGIDCAPATPRPNTYIEAVAKMFGVTDIPVTDSRAFGAWTWRFTDIPEEVWLSTKVEIKAYFERLYNDGYIRGAQHYWDSAIESYINEKITLETLMLRHLTPEDICEILGSEEEKRLFTEDFDYAKGVVDQMFKTYEGRLTSAK
jgi:hypothetical protein